MKLYLLEPTDQGYIDNKVYTNVVTDICHVVRAKGIPEARQLAYIKFASDLWLNEEHSSCVELTPEGDAGVICTEIMESQY